MIHKHPKNTFWSILNMNFLFLIYSGKELPSPIMFNLFVKFITSLAESSKYLTSKLVTTMRPRVHFPILPPWKSVKMDD